MGPQGNANTTYGFERDICTAGISHYPVYISQYFSNRLCFEEKKIGDVVLIYCIYCVTEMVEIIRRQWQPVYVTWLMMYAWKRSSNARITKHDLGLHYNGVIMGTMASQITSFTIVSSIVYQTQIRENIKAPRHWPLWGEFTGDQWIPRIKGQ